MNILIVEDNISIAAFIDNAIEKLGHQAQTSRTGMEALRRTSEQIFDLVLLDLSLPDMKAGPLIHHLKTLSSQTDIVTMTDFNSRELEMEVRTQGVSFYMIRPFDIGHLNKIINHISKRHEANHENQSQS